MGIHGLLPALKSICTPAHVKEYAGKTVAVDTYCWLHRGAITCSKELCQGQTSSKLIDYCLHKVNLLKHHGVRPLLIFDGGLLPMKEEQEAKRARARKDNLERALKHESSGNHAAAYECYQKAVDITPAIAFQLIKVLRTENIDFIVAPYEADAQMTFLSLNGYVEAVITEDSDMIPFGCGKVLFKMDKFGQGVQFQYSDLVKNKDLNFVNFTRQMILEMCILSGCDYLPSLQGMGLKKAHALIRRFKSYPKVIKHLKLSGVFVRSNYEEDFMKAVLTFCHQRVYDPSLGELVHLTPTPQGIDIDLEFVGPAIPSKIAQAIAKGELDPLSEKAFEDVNTTGPALSTSGKVNKTQRNLKRQLSLPVQKNSLTNYFLSATKEAKQQFKAPRYKCHELDHHTLSSSDKENFQILPRNGVLNGSQDTTITSEKSFSSEVQDYPPVLPAEPRLDDITKFEIENLPPMNKQQEGGDLDEGYCGVRKHILAVKEKIAIGGVSNLNRLNSFTLLNHQSSSSSLTRKSFIEVGNQQNRVVRSAYFSSKFNKSDLNILGDTQSPHGVDPLDLILDGGFRSDNLEMNYSDSISHDFATERTEEDFTIQTEDSLHIDSGEGEIEKEIAANKGNKRPKDADLGERQHIPAFSSSVLGSDPAPCTSSFAADVSHIGRYASIAHDSVERFASRIAAFRCSSVGARASGLRRPPKPEKHSRGSYPRDVAEDLDVFTFAPDSRHISAPSKQVLVSTGSVKWDSSSSDDWT